MENKISIGIDCNGGDTIKGGKGILEKALEKTLSTVKGSLNGLNGYNQYLDLALKELNQYRKEESGNRQHPTERILKASARAAMENPGLELILVGNMEKMKQVEIEIPKNITLLPSKKIYSQDEVIRRAVEGSSLYELVSLSLDNSIDSFFTIGDTSKAGIELLRLGRFKKTKPTLVAGGIPNHENGFFDLGDAGATSLNQEGDISYSKGIENFAQDIYRQLILVMTYSNKISENKKLRLALNSNGPEEHKGTDIVIATDKLIRKSLEKGFLKEIDYLGKMEINEVTKGRVDIFIADGFTGNTIIKTMKATARLAKYFVEDEIRKMSLFEKGYLITAAPAIPILLKLKKDIENRANSDRYNGAPLLGFRGNIVKGHGESNQEAIYHGIKKAIDVAKLDIVPKLEENLSKYSL